MKRYSVKQILEMEPCSYYSKDILEKLWNGRERLSASQIVKLDIDSSDINWFIVNAKVTVYWKDEDGDKLWFVDGELHRENKPALIYTSGDRYWFRKGLLHRKDGPACDTRFRKEWHINGLLHRKDGPALIYTNGMSHWYRHGQLRDADPNYVEENTES